jgi:hypothetical protein
LWGRRRWLGQAGLAWNLETCWLGFLSAGIIGMNHHTCVMTIFLGDFQNINGNFKQLVVQSYHCDLSSEMWNIYHAFKKVLTDVYLQKDYSITYNIIKQEHQETLWVVKSTTVFKSLLR